VADPSAVTRVLLHSGKIHYDLVAEREARGATNVALVRLEQFYPLPDEQLRTGTCEIPASRAGVGAGRTGKPRSMAVYRCGVIGAQPAKGQGFLASGLGISRYRIIEAQQRRTAVGLRPRLRLVPLAQSLVNALLELLGGLFTTRSLNGVGNRLADPPLVLTARATREVVRDIKPHRLVDFVVEEVLHPVPGSAATTISHR